MEVPAKSTVRFAGFVLDLSTGELHSNGDKTYLQEKPFQILTLLLERPGELVTRDQLVKQLWPDGTFVDFDQSLNKAVNRLREALGDSADQPRLIETLPRRGYRFIGEVESEATPATLPESSATPNLTPRSTARSWWMKWLLASALTLMAIVISFRWIEARRADPNPLQDVKQRRLTANSSENAVISGVISPDGKLLAYSDLKGIHIQQIETGQVRDLPLPEGFKGIPQSWEIMNTWIRDGSAIIADAAPSGQPPSVWLIPVTGEPMRKIRDNAYAWTVSRDGLWVAFGANLDKLYYHELWVMRPDGTDAHKVFDADKDAAYGGAEFSPDGRRLAYVNVHQSLEQAEVTFESRSLTGGPATTALVVKYPYDVEDWSWSPDGRMIYSLVDEIENTCTFWLLRLDPRTGEPIEKPKPLTNWSGFYMDHPSFSADGKHLTFLRSSLQSTLYLADLRAGGAPLSAPVHLTMNEGQNDFIGWAPDNKTVVFVSDRSGHPEFFRQSAGEDSAVRITSTFENLSRDYHTSPDGAWILYFAYPHEGGTSQPVNLMRVPLAGGIPNLVLSSSVARHPATLCVIAEAVADHTHLVFTEVDLLRGRGRELARFEIKTTPDVQYTWDVSPDGTRIAILKQSEATIALLSLVGNSSQAVVAKASLNLYSLDWSADGQGLFVSALAKGGATLLHLDLNGNTQILWYSKGGIREPGDVFRSGTLAPRAVPSPDGRYLAIQGQSVNSNIWMMENF
jgi:Tol biopolymer transport system component/DNA-binding winged helix-turn-helix (wHTH) protein